MSAVHTARANHSMHPSVIEMIDRYGVTNECREFLSQQQMLYIDGEFTTGSGNDRLEVIEPSTGQLLTSIIYPTVTLLPGILKRSQ